MLIVLVAALAAYLLFTSGITLAVEKGGFSIHKWISRAVEPVNVAGFIVAVTFTLLSLPSSAQVYKWTDADGNVHFGNQPPPGQQEEVKIRDTRIGSAVQPPNSKEESREASDSERVSAREKLIQLERNAAKSACSLAKGELASAERKLTLALSIDRDSPMVSYRENQIELWERRVRIECLGSE